MDTLTVRLSPEVKTRLDKLARATSRPRSFLIQTAVQEYLALNEWQVEAIREGLQQADEGRLIPHKDIRKRWEGKRAHPVD